MPDIVIPKVSPELIKPTIRRLKSFIASPETITNAWDSPWTTWDNDIVAWAETASFEQQEKPGIGGIKLKTPSIENVNSKIPGIYAPKMKTPEIR